MVSCAVCGLLESGNLCERCAAELDTPLPFVSEQVLSATVRPEAALLIDAWGRLHPIERTMRVGRSPTARGLSLFHASVSRVHAELRLDDEQWAVHDLQSSNGTRLNDEDVAGSSRLTHGDRVSFGAVGFYFVLDDGHRGSPNPKLGSRTLRPEDAEPADRIQATPTDVTIAGLPRLGIRLSELPAGGGGFLEAAGQLVRLSGPQLELMQMLVSRMRDQGEVSPLVRGFVPTGQLIADLSWDAIDPDENNLKQLIRRIRRALDEGRLGGLIESRRGFGYRLRVIPIDLMHEPGARIEQ